jgi:hypothetical protein
LFAAPGDGVADGLHGLAADDLALGRLLRAHRVQEGLRSQALLVRTWRVSKKTILRIQCRKLIFRSFLP